MFMPSLGDLPKDNQWLRRVTFLGTGDYPNPKRGASGCPHFITTEDGDQIEMECYVLDVTRVTVETTLSNPHRFKVRIDGQECDGFSKVISMYTVWDALTCPVITSQEDEARMGRCWLFRAILED